MPLRRKPIFRACRSSPCNQQWLLRRQERCTGQNQSKDHLLLCGVWQVKVKDIFIDSCAAIHRQVQACQSQGSNRSICTKHTYAWVRRWIWWIPWNDIAATQLEPNTGRSTWRRCSSNLHNLWIREIRSIERVSQSISSIIVQQREGSRDDQISSIMGQEEMIKC